MDLRAEGRWNKLREPDMAVPIHPCISRHSGILPIRCRASFRGHGRMETEFPINERAARIAELDGIIGIQFGPSEALAIYP